MADDLLTILTRFHREIVLPDIDRIVEKRVDVVERKVSLILGHLDAIYARFDRLESEYVALSATVGRMESDYQTLSATVGRIDERTRGWPGY